MLGICPGAHGAAGAVPDGVCEFDDGLVLFGVVDPEGEPGVVELDPLGAVVVAQGTGVVVDLGVLVCVVPPGCVPGTGAGVVGVVPLCGVDGAGCVCGVEGLLCV